MKKRIAIAATGVVMLTAALSVLAWNDQNANDAALYATNRAVCVTAVDDADAVLALTDEVRAAATSEQQALARKRLAVAHATYRESRDACKAAQR